MLGLATGAVVVYVWRYTTPLRPCTPPCSPGPYGSFPVIWFAVFGVALLLISLVSFAGVRVVFMLGAISSLIIIALVLLSWGDYPLFEEATVLVLSVVTLLADLLASRPARGLSERDSPLNLPVFG